MNENDIEKGASVQNSSIWDVVSGNESLKIDIGLTWNTIMYLFLAAMLVGTLLILIKKNIK